ncbi:hypothetical protein OESDEN_06156 [Oesophagostomum dentatum]|uniref:Uncharacterized protein n=1 Tax=Oesophagostomum dentatum TaxID=61180 RepID=A0A0B1TEV8_OESDE|nr:hypothetical protein OESDEN_06156 [Oesophagostomum dentatum]
MNRYLAAVFLFGILVAFVHGGCYSHWSRCTPQMAFPTGIVWQSCAHYCRQCLGRTYGSCQRVYTMQCSGYQCRCGGGWVPPSSNMLIMATCRFGV